MLIFFQIFIPLIFFVICLKRLDLALYLLIAELVLGGAGGRWLFYPYGLSIRIVLLGLFFAVWLIKLIFKKIHFKTKDQKIIYFILILSLGYPLFFGLIMNFFHPKNLSYLINDSNGWIFYLISLPMIMIIDSMKKFWRLVQVYFASSILIGSLVSLLYFMSSLGLINIWEVQNFLLERGLQMGGKIGIMPDGALRIFLGSSIFLPFGLFMFLSLKHCRGGLKKNHFFSKIANHKFFFSFWKALGLLLIYFAVIASYTRGLWIGIILGLAFFMLWVNWRKRLQIIIGAVVLVFLTQIIFQTVFHTSFINVFLGRMVSTISTVKDPVSVGARVSQIKVLGKYILKHPFLGTGFGTTIQGYREGVIAPFSFELGYLDMLVKFGFLGFAFWVVFILYLFFRALRILWFDFQITQQTKMVFVALFSGLITLLFVSGTSPFISSSFGIVQILLLLTAVSAREKSA